MGEDLRVRERVKGGKNGGRLRVDKRRGLRVGKREEGLRARGGGNGEDQRWEKEEGLRVWKGGRVKSGEKRSFKDWEKERMGKGKGW